MCHQENPIQRDYVITTAVEKLCWQYDKGYLHGTLEMSISRVPFIQIHMTKSFTSLTTKPDTKQFRRHEGPGVFVGNVISFCVWTPNYNQDYN